MCVTKRQQSYGIKVKKVAEVMSSRISVTRAESKDNTSRECKTKKRVNDLEVPVEEPESKSKQARELEEEGCGQRVGGVNFMASEVEQFQKMTKSRVKPQEWTDETAWKRSH